MIYPPLLQQGDRVALVSPAGRMDEEPLLRAVQVLQEWGIVPEVFPHALDRCGRFAASDSDRLADLTEAIVSPDIKAIVCCRGGYGVVRLLDQIDPLLLTKNPKWIVGYSDITLLHALAYRAGVVSLHAPMLGHLAKAAGGSEAAEWLREVLFGKKVTYTIPAHRLNRVGEVQGMLVGGNLSVLCGLRGTPYEADYTKKILFIEDIAEHPYHLERMMYTLKLGGVLANLSGLIVGHFTDCKEDEGLGYTVYEMVATMVAEYDYPCCFGFPVGHEEANLPLLHGGEVTLSVTDKEVTIEM